MRYTTERIVRDKIYNSGPRVPLTHNVSQDLCHCESHVEILMTAEELHAGHFMCCGRGAWLCMQSGLSMSAMLGRPSRVP